MKERRKEWKNLKKKQSSSKIYSKNTDKNHEMECNGIFNKIYYCGI